ncbi:tetratricopeptide repeat protein [Myxococcota bacterium]
MNRAGAELGLFFSGSAHVALALTAVVLGTLGFLPLFGGPGYEASLAAGLVLPPIAATSIAVQVVNRRLGPGPALELGFGLGAVLALVGLVISWAHGLRAGYCDPWHGTVLYLLGGGSGAVMGGAWGAAAGVLARCAPRFRRTLAVGAGLFGPALGIAVSLGRFYSSPMVFAFDPFFGVFAGPLYDTVIDCVGRLAIYRLGSLATLLAASVLAASARCGSRGWRWVRLPRAVWVVGGVCAVVSVAHSLAGPHLGHYVTSQSLREALGRRVVVGRCEVIHPPSVMAHDATALGEDCDRHLEELGEYLGTDVPARVEVFLFASAAEKGRWMGASRTQIAKPWSNQVYLQNAAYPHPALRHELAHVVAGRLGQGPFSVAGPWGGWLPDPGRIEGVAVAAAPDEDADLTLAEWAKAMLDLGILPPLERVFRLSFLGENSAKAYTVAGSFVAWLHERYGREAVGRWYGGQELIAITGKTLATLELEWKQSLQAVSLPPAAREAARLRFDRPSVFGRRCPRLVDRLHRDAVASLNQGDYQGARRLWEELLRFDPGHVAGRLALGTCALREGNGAEARRRYRAVADDSTLRVLDRAQAQELLADREFAQGRVEGASRTYRALAPRLLTAAEQRELELKQGVMGNPLGERAVAALLVGDARVGPDWAVAAALLGAWSEARPDDGTADYLLGRNFFLRGRWRDGAQRLDRALARPIAHRHVEREAIRMRLVVACAEGDQPSARRAYARFAALPGTRRALVQGVHALARRCGAAP